MSDGETVCFFYIYALLIHLLLSSLSRLNLVFAMEKCLNKYYKHVESDEFYEDYLEAIGASKQV